MKFIGKYSDSKLAKLLINYPPVARLSKKHSVYGFASVLWFDEEEGYEMLFLGQVLPVEPETEITFWSGNTKVI